MLLDRCVGVLGGFVGVLAPDSVLVPLDRKTFAGFDMFLVGIEDGSGFRPRFNGSHSDRDMPVDTPGLLGLFHSPHFLLSGRAGIAPCSVSTFAHSATRRESFCTFLLTLFCLVWLVAVATYLGCVTLNADVTIMVATEALLDPAGTVVELALVDLTLPCHSCIDDGIGHFWFCEFNDDGR